jgi:hypothetical protein
MRTYTANGSGRTTPHVGLWLAERADLMRYYERFTDEMLALASESAS